MSRLMCHSAIVLTSLAMLLLGGCREVDVTDPKVRDTVREINEVFQAGYVQVLAEIGTRRFQLTPSTAARAMRLALESLGFTTTMREGDHYLAVSGPAPIPLDAAEWKDVIAVDEPQLKRIAVSHLGIKGNFARFETEGLAIDGTITFLPRADGVEISITMKLRETARPAADSILPRRDYAPPTALRAGYEKIWRVFEQQALPLAVMAAP